MFRQPAQTLDVLADQLRCPVVVVQNGQYPVHDGMVDLSEADVDAEDEVDEVVDEDVKLGAEE